MSRTGGPSHRGTEQRQRTDRQKTRLDRTEVRFSEAELEGLYYWDNRRQNAEDQDLRAEEDSDTEDSKA